MKYVAGLLKTPFLKVLLHEIIKKHSKEEEVEVDSHNLLKQEYFSSSLLGSVFGICEVHMAAS
jgi:hypothetical protein